MATQEIIIKYKADVGNLEAELGQVIKAQDELIDATKANTKEQQKAITSQEFAAKKRADLLKNEQKQLELLRQRLKLAFDPKDIQRVNNEIAQTQKRISLLDGTYRDVKVNVNKANDEIIGGFKRIAGALGLAFSIESVIQFSKVAVDAFIQSEKSVKLLSNTIIGIGGESQQAFDSLNAQAELFGATTNESAESIRSAQVALKNYGLSASEINQLLPGLIGAAKQTGQSLESLASGIGSALEGSGKQFKNLGANIDSTKTQLENYNEIVRALSVFSDSATISVESLGGALTLQEKKINQLTTDIGSKLAPAWVAAKSAVVDYIAAVLNIPTTGKEVAASALPEIQKETTERINQLRAEGKSTSDIIAFLRGDLDKAAEESKIASDNLAKVNEEYGGFLSGISKVTNTNYRLIAQTAVNTANQVNEIKKAQENVLLEQITALQRELQVNEELLKVNDLKKISTADLQKLLEENQKKNDQINQSNVKNITKELELRKQQEDQVEKLIAERNKLINSLKLELSTLQAVEEARKLQSLEPRGFDEAIEKYTKIAEVQKKAVDDEINNKIKEAKANETYTQEVAALYEKIRKFRKDAIDFNKLNELTIFDEAQQEQIKASLQAIEDLKFQDALQLKADEIEENNQRVAESFEELKNSLSRGDFAVSEQQLRENTQRLNDSINQEFETRKAAIQRTAELQIAALGTDEVSAAKRQEIAAKADAEIEKLNREKNDKILANETATNDAIATGTEELSERIKANYEAVAQQVGALFNEIAALSSVFTEKRIDDINKELEAELEAIEIAKEANEQAFEKRRINEDEFNKTQLELLDQQKKAEEATQKKINQEKRKQAILDKAAALFQIGLNTAIALSNPSNLASFGALSPFIAALGALQAAAVLAQPIPYKKGSKNTGRKDHLAKVGEEGEELVWMPANSKVLPHRQTKRYSDVIDAMYDNKLDDYIYKNYVTPALMQQKAKKEQQDQRSFAENITKSLTYNNVGLSASDLEAQRKRGQYIRNVDEIAEAIASKLPVRDIYR